VSNLFLVSKSATSLRQSGPAIQVPVTRYLLKLKKYLLLSEYEWNGGPPNFADPSLREGTLATVEFSLARKPTISAKSIVLSC
jgi:hypothetical protein